MCKELNLAERSKKRENKFLKNLFRENLYL